MLLIITSPCPQELGGLGILDLKTFGYALRARWVWLQRSFLHRPQEKQVVAMVNGDTTFFLVG